MILTTIICKCGYQTGYACEHIGAGVAAKDAEIVALKAERDQLRAALEFYADGSSWTTNDGEYHFIKVIDKDWIKREDGGYSAGMIARKTLAKIREALK